MSVLYVLQPRRPPRRLRLSPDRHPPAQLSFLAPGYITSLSKGLALSPMLPAATSSQQLVPVSLSNLLYTLMILMIVNQRQRQRQRRRALPDSLLHLTLSSRWISAL
jgi:hypothetical protein